MLYFINSITPLLFIILNYYFTFLLLNKKKIDLSDNLIVSFIISNCSIIIFNKIFLYFKIITFYKIIIFVLIILFIFFLWRNLILIKEINYNIIKFYKGLKKNFYFFFVVIFFFYCLIQSILLPPANFDSLAYHITRNFIFINEQSIYPSDNFTHQNQIIMPLNFDLLYFTHAMFSSDFFLNIFNFYSYFILSIATRRILIFLGVNKKIVLSYVFIFIGLSNILLSSLSTKNDLFLLVYLFISIYFLLSLNYKYQKRNFYFFFITLAYAIGIKWNFIFLALPISFIVIIYILKKKLFLNQFNTFVKLSPLLILILPIDSLTYNFIYSNSFTGTNYNESSSFLHIDGAKGMFANIIRYIITSIDITLPINRIGFNFFENSFDQINAFLQNLIFHKNDLGINSNFKDSLKYSYEYSLRPHSDYTWYGLLGFIFFISPIVFYKHKSVAYLCLNFVALFYLLCISYFISWFPWNGRHLMPYIGLGFLLTSRFKIFSSKKIIYICKIYTVLLISFNILTNIPQPIIKHSRTDSWLSAVNERESYKIFSIPEIFEVKELKKFLNDSNKVIVIYERELDSDQNVYEILKDYKGNYFKFITIEMKNHSLKKEEISLKEIKNFKYLINITTKQLSTDFYGLDLKKIETRNKKFKAYKIQQ
jgi:hypothetical protein